MQTIRLGIIGAGGRGIMSFGEIFTTRFRDEVSLVALGEPNRERAEAGLAFLGVKADIHSDPLEVMDRKDVDAVVVTSVDRLHEEHCVTAFHRGKHVLVDKPLAITAKGCLRVIEASRRAGKLLYMGFNLRHNPAVSRLKCLVDKGEIGQLFSVQATEYYNGGRTYHSRWNRLKKNTGGLFIHKGSHDFDVINWLMAPARPARVSCFASVFVFKPENLPFKPMPGVKPGPTCTACPYKTKCPDAHPYAVPVGTSGAREKDLARNRMFSPAAAKQDGYHKDLCMYLSDKDTHDQGIAIVEFDNGATAAHAEYFATPIDNRLYSAEGTRGHAFADLAANRIELKPRWSTDTITHQIGVVKGGHSGADPLMCAEFVDCVRRGRRPTASGIDGAWSVAVAESAELSRAKRRTIRISEVLDTGSDLLKPRH